MGGEVRVHLLHNPKIQLPNLVTSLLHTTPHTTSQHTHLTPSHFTPSHLTPSHFTPHPSHSLTLHTIPPHSLTLHTTPISLPHTSHHPTSLPHFTPHPSHSLTLHTTPISLPHTSHHTHLSNISLQCSYLPLLLHHPLSPPLHPFTLLLPTSSLPSLPSQLFQFFFQLVSHSLLQFLSPLTRTLHGHNH